MDYIQIHKMDHNNNGSLVPVITLILGFTGRKQQWGKQRNEAFQIIFIDGFPRLIADYMRFWNAAAKAKKIK